MSNIGIRESNLPIKYLPKPIIHFTLDGEEFHTCKIGELVRGIQHNGRRPNGIVVEHAKGYVPAESEIAWVYQQLAPCLSKEVHVNN